jgi:hypothetical protein
VILSSLVAPNPAPKTKCSGLSGPTRISAISVVCL